MFLMAEQYSRELLMEIEGRQAPSPIMRFWRESLQRLSPAQMREGLRLYMKSERGSYKPNPEDIVHNAVDIQVKDKPVKRKDPNCPECGGSGFRQVEVKSRTRPGSKIKAVADCYCVRIDYAGKTFTSTGKQLAERSGDHPSPPPSGPGSPGDRARDPMTTAASQNRACQEPRVIEKEDSARGSEPFRPITSAIGIAKAMPRTKPLNDTEYNERRQMLERQKEKILAKE
jgi:hypothetical protein